MFGYECYNYSIDDDSKSFPSCWDHFSDAKYFRHHDTLNADIWVKELNVSMLRSLLKLVLFLLNF